MAVLSFGMSQDHYKTLLGGVGPPWSTLPALKGTAPWLVFSLSADNPAAGTVWIYLRARHTGTGQTCQFGRWQLKVGVKSTFANFPRIIVPADNLVEARWSGVGLGGQDVMIHYIALG